MLTKNADTDAIYLDFAKAFDKVDHRIVKWIKFFSSDRKQCVVLNGVLSLAAAIIALAE